MEILTGMLIPASPVGTVAPAPTTQAVDPHGPNQPFFLRKEIQNVWYMINKPDAHRKVFTNAHITSDFSIFVHASNIFHSAVPCELLSILGFKTSILCSLKAFPHCHLLQAVFLDPLYWNTYHCTLLLISSLKMVNFLKGLVEMGSHRLFVQAGIEM
jgi:hypothetical protein